jgi:hypothetical protein
MAAVRSSEYTGMASGQDRRGEAIVVKREEEVEARGGGKQARKKTHQQGVTPYPYCTTGGTVG